jgi:hypothetical protein
MAMQGQKNNNNSGAAAASPAEPSFSTPAAQPAASASAAAPAPSAAASVPASTGGKIGTVSSTQNVSAGCVARFFFLVCLFLADRYWQVH